MRFLDFYCLGAIMLVGANACATVIAPPPESPVIEIDYIGGSGWRVTGVDEYLGDKAHLAPIMDEVNGCLGTDASLEDLDLYIASSIHYMRPDRSWSALQDQ